MKMLFTACILLLSVLFQSCEKCETCVTTEEMYQYGFKVAESSSSTDLCNDSDIKEAEGTTTFNGLYNGHPTQVTSTTKCN